MHGHDLATGEHLAFGAALKRYRGTAGLTQEELAERAHLSVRAISDLERGARRAPYRATVRLLATALALSPQDAAALEAAARPRGAALARVLTFPVPHGAAPDDEAEARPDQALPSGGFLGALPTGALVARDEELARILSIVGGVAGGQGQLVLVAGEPGVGKTRLAQEVMLRVQQRGFAVAAGRCYAPTAAVPFYPFGEALATLYAAAPASVRADAPRRWPYLGRLLPDELGAVALAPSDSGEEQQRLFRAVGGFVGAIAAATPVALLLDDLHWADSASLALLAHLARQTRAHRVLLLGTYRDDEVGRQHPLARTLHELHREHLVERVPVRRLGEEGTAALMAATLGEATASAELARLVHEQTEGNPFFTQEVLRALVERGDVYQRDGRWERRAVAEIVVPESVRSVIGERLARLPTEAQELLYQASVLGPVFSFDDLQALSARAEEAVEAALEEGRVAGLLREMEHDAYAFNHTLTQQVLYNELSARRKRRWHRAAGAALERLPERARERRAAELAWHFVEGDDAERAVPCALLAGDQAERVFAHREAERHYRTALELARERGDRPREAEALEKLGVVQRILARYDEALEVLEQAARFHRAAGDVESEARVMARIGRVHADRGTPRAGIDRLRPLLHTLELSGASPGLARLGVALAHLFWACSQYEEQLAAADRAADLARGREDVGLVADAAGMRGQALLWLGRVEEGLAALEEAMGAAEAANDLDSLHKALDTVAFVHAYRGDLARSKAYAVRALETAQRLGNPALLAAATAFEGWLASCMGEWTEARDVLEQAVALSRQVGLFAEAIHPLLYLGELLMYMGLWDEARHCLDEGLREAERQRDGAALHSAVCKLAELELLEGRPEAARVRLVSLLDSGGHEAAWLLARLACAYLDLDEVAAAAETAHDAVRVARAMGNQLALGDALRAQALVALRQGHWEAAARASEEGLTLRRGMPHPYEEARLLQVSALLHAQKDEPEPAREALEAALAIFRRLGAHRDAERVEQALADL